MEKDNLEIVQKLETSLITKVLNQYLNSGDFNGYALDELITFFEEKKANLDVLKFLILKMIDEEIISLECGDRHPNPMIKALEPLPKAEQMKKLNEVNLKMCCLYPTSKYLENNLDKNKYLDKPFTLKLALGEPQLKFYSFDLKVLKIYINDPRYIFKNNNDIQGTIYVKDGQTLENREKIYIKTFGYSRNRSMKRALSVPLTYLSDLTSEKQKLWESHLVTGFEPYTEYKMIVFGHGHLLHKISGLEALMTEINYINQIIHENFQENIFKSLNRPKKLLFMMMPTKNDFYDFASTLDLVLSDNLEKSFFKNRGLELDKIIQKNSLNVLEPKGTITLLREWIDKAFSLADSDQTQLNEIINFFREVRKLRSKEAHSEIEDEWSDEFFFKQRDLIILSIERIRTLRMLLQKHLGSQLVLEPYNTWVY